MCVYLFADIQGTAAAFCQKEIVLNQNGFCETSSSYIQTKPTHWGRLVLRRFKKFETINQEFDP